MKKLAYIFLIPLMIAVSSVVKAQDYAEGYLGLPGDNLNLFAVMKLFQESETLEGFERSLNNENSRINNLDLNGDNQIDYIRVIDNPDGNVHFIVLQVAINARENQDVAVFIVQREADNQVRIQLIGDEALYGKDYIIEPNYNAYANETPNPGYMGNTTVVDGQTVVVNRVTTYEVAAWPLIRFIFLPGYIIWHSPWYWGYYPHWWHPWRPYYWHYYYGYHYHWYPEYYGYYRHGHHNYYPRYNNYYYGSRRANSPYVATRIKSGYYKTTYSHPEMRKAGSELYTKTYPDNRRQATNRPKGVSSGTQPTRSSGTTTRRSSTQQGTTKGTVTNETRRSSTGTGVSNTPARRASEATTTRSSTQNVTRKSTVTTETKRSSTGSGVSNAPARRASEATTSRSSAPRETSKSTVKTETRRTSTGSKASTGSSSRKASGSSQVKSKTSKSSGSEKSGEQTKGTSTRRR
jgi:hypothetical protein